MRMAVSGGMFIVALMASQAACVKSAPPPRVFHSGDRVEVGTLVYTILEADWKTQLAEGGQVREPVHRFVTIRLSVTNAGAQATTVPSLKLVDEQGQTFGESFDGQLVSSWLGLVRKVKPADTLEGNILFDVQPKSYKLKLNEDGQPGQLALVEIPLRFGLEQPAVPSAIEAPLK